MSPNIVTRNICYNYYPDEEIYFVMLYYDVIYSRYVKYYDIVTHITEAVIKFEEEKLNFPSCDIIMIPYVEYLVYLQNGESEIIQSLDINDSDISDDIDISISWVRLLPEFTSG